MAGLKVTGTLESVTLANYSILYAETALDEDYYRLTDVESRIPKFCVGKLRRTCQGRLVDPLSVRSIRKWAAKCRGDYEPQANVY